MPRGREGLGGCLFGQAVEGGTSRWQCENAGDDQGTGLFGMIMGFTVFLLLLVASVQILFNLYATTVVSSAAVDAARIVAGYDSAGSRCATTAEAEAAFWQALGDYNQRGSATLTWVCNDSETVSLAVVADHPTILPQQLRGLTGLGRFDRVIEIRVEDMR